MAQGTSWKIAVLSAALAACSAAAPGVATPAPQAATVANAATITLHPARDVAASPDAVVVTVQEFRPSPHGPVQIVIDAGGEGTWTEIGRVAIYPERGFSAGQPEKAQHFRLPLELGSTAARPAQLRIRIVPSRGSGAEARVVAEGRIASDF